MRCPQAVGQQRPRQGLPPGLRGCKRKQTPGNEPDTGVNETAKSELWGQVLIPTVPMQLQPTLGRPFRYTNWLWPSSAPA